jgi:rRNA-processing protein CGR1
MVTRLQSRTLPKPDGKNGNDGKRRQAKAAKPGDLAKKTRLREKTARIKQLSKEVKNQIEEDRERAKRSRLDAAKRKQEQMRKNAQTQEIKNVKAIKKLSPKQRRRARIFLKHELDKAL